MPIAGLIAALQNKHERTGFTLHPPVSSEEIRQAEERLQTKLPADFREFYSICNGFECAKEIFHMIRAEKLFYDHEYGLGCIIFAEYLIYADVWAFRKLDGESYEIIYSDGKETILTNSLKTFLERLLLGHVFEKDGLFDWVEELRNPA